MTEIKGIKISKLPFEIFIQGDILAPQGPILSHFKNEKNQDYFMFWVDSDHEYNRWLLFEVSPVLFQKYLDKRLSLKNVLLNDSKGFAYFVDIDKDVNYKNITRILRGNIPEDLLPGEQSFFNEIFAEEYALKLYGKLKRLTE